MNIPASKLLNGFLRESITPELKKAGFVGKGRVFRRSMGDALQVVEIQNWKYNDPERARFTLEVGVCFPGILTEVSQFDAFSFYRPYVENPGITLCSLRERLGMFLDTPEDHWWEVNAVTGHLPDPPEILNPLLQKAVPWLDTWSSLAFFVQNGTPGDGQLGIAALAACGRLDEAIAAAHRHAKFRHQQDAEAEQVLFCELERLVNAVAAKYAK